MREVHKRTGYSGDCAIARESLLLFRN